jgi:hypothetical protein
VSASSPLVVELRSTTGSSLRSLRGRAPFNVAVATLSTDPETGYTHRSPEPTRLVDTFRPQSLRARCPGHAGGVESESGLGPCAGSGHPIHWNPRTTDVRPPRPGTRSTQRWCRPPLLPPFRDRHPPTTRRARLSPVHGGLQRKMLATLRVPSCQRSTGHRAESPPLRRPSGTDPNRHRTPSTPVTPAQRNYI